MIDLSGCEEEAINELPGYVSIRDWGAPPDAEWTQLESGSAPKSAQLIIPAGKEALLHYSGSFYGAFYACSDAGPLPPDAYQYITLPNLEDTQDWWGVRPGFFDTIQKWTSLRGLEFEHHHFDPGEWAELAKIKTLERLYIPFTDSGSIKPLDGLPRLAWLSIYYCDFDARNTRVADWSLHRSPPCLTIPRLPSLRALTIDNGRDAPPRIDFAAGSPKLEELRLFNIERAEVSPVYIYNRYFSGADNLRKLEIATWLGWGELAQIARLPSLEELDFNEPAGEGPPPGSIFKEARNLRRIGMTISTSPSTRSPAIAHFFREAQACPKLEEVGLTIDADPQAGVPTLAEELNGIASLKRVDVALECSKPSFYFGDDLGQKLLREFGAVRMLKSAKIVIHQANLQFSAEDLAFFGQSRELESLEISVSMQGHAVTGRPPFPGLSFLRGLTALRELCLEGAGFGDADMAHVGSLPRLKTLVIRGVRLGDIGMSALRQATELEQLYASEPASSISTQGLEYLADLPKLRVLRLYHLGNFKAREIPDLDSTIHALRRMKSLRNLAFAPVLQTTAEFKRWQAAVAGALPDCHVSIEWALLPPPPATPAPKPLS